MKDWGFSRDEVVAAISTPEYRYPHEHDPELVVVAAGRVRVPYNPLTGEVVTVMPRQDHDSEARMSGWVNLDARQAEKLLLEWGFTVHSAKDKSNLWHHPFDYDTLIPFSIPSRGARANGKGSFNKAAAVVGVSVHDFLKGPDDEVKAKVRILRGMDEAMAEADGPDPLGIKGRVAAAKLAGFSQEADAVLRGIIPPDPTAQTPAEPLEAPMPTYTPSDEKILAGLLEATSPVTARDLSQTLGMHDVTVREGLRKAVREGDAYVIGKRKRAGSPSDLFWYEPTWTEPVPEATAPTPDPVPTPQETPVADAAVIDLTQPTPAAAPAPAAAKEKLFTATGTPWPTGGILIQDEDGVFYVARKLVEEGR